MKAFVSSILSLSLLSTLLFLSGGCAQNKQVIARLEQENAQQRERIWQSNRKMEDFRQENEALRQQIATLQNRNNPQVTGTGNWSPASVPATTQATVPTVQSTVSPTVQTVPPTTVQPTTVQPTTVQPTTVQPTTTPQLPTTTLGVPASPETIPVNPPTGTQAQVAPAGTIRVRKTDSRNVASVQILPEKTKAIHYEGLHAEFQLRDAAGNIALAAAPVVVMVTDPTKTGNESRVSKWNYSAEDIADIINSGQAGISIPLNMAWAKSCPQNLELELHILYCTSDKRMLTHRARINLASGLVSSSQGGLTLETANPAVGTQVQTTQRPEWGPNP